jgi:uncharacterized phiE125 gp8 family phage protein
MRYTRTNRTTAEAVSAADLAAYLRLDGSLVGEVVPFGEAAALEVEAYANIALLDQTIVATTGTFPGTVIDLPVGPAPAIANVTVGQIELDGTITPVDGSAYWFEAGQFPRLHFTTTPAGPLRITYEAGYGDNAGAIPEDLALAVKDHANKLYDMRAAEGRGITAGLSHAAARITARHRRVAL